MSVLASLVRAYERLPDAPPFGLFVGEDRLSDFAERRWLAGGAADRPARRRRQEARRRELMPVPASFKTARHHATFVFPLGQYRLCAWRDGS